MIEMMKMSPVSIEWMNAERGNKKFSFNMENAKSYIEMMSNKDMRFFSNSLNVYKANFQCFLKKPKSIFHPSKQDRLNCLN
jgi:hypothetical protein